MTKVCKCFLTLLPLFYCLLAAAQLPVVLINRPDSDTDQRYLYPERLLQIILARTENLHGRVDLQRADVSMSRDRQFVELQKGELMHVMAEAPKPEWEKLLLPVRIPIRKGLQGYRLFLIQQNDQALLGSITTLDDLKRLPTGSGAQWSTMQVMQDSGFKVITSSSYEGLFEMLSRDRFKTFGRGLNEAYAELAVFKDKYPDLVVDESVILYIPLPTYFFVTPRYPELAKRIEQGLNEMIADGSFDTFFCEHHRSDILRAKLEQRRFFCISNPNLSAQTPLDRAEYWTSEACGLKQEHRCLP